MARPEPSLLVGRVVGQVAVDADAAAGVGVGEGRGLAQDEAVAGLQEWRLFTQATLSSNCQWVCLGLTGRKAGPPEMPVRSWMFRLGRPSRELGDVDALDAELARGLGAEVGLARLGVRLREAEPELVHHRGPEDARPVEGAAVGGQPGVLDAGHVGAEVEARRREVGRGAGSTRPGPGARRACTCCSCSARRRSRGRPSCGRRAAVKALSRTSRLAVEV